MVLSWVIDHLKTKSRNLVSSVTGPFKLSVHQCHLHRFASISCVLGVKSNLIWETSSLQWQWQSSQTLCIVDVLWPPGGETAAFQTDLECLCCCSITLYQSAVSASSHPAGSHQQQLMQSLLLCFTWERHIRRSKGHAVSLGFIPLEVDLQIHTIADWRRRLQRRLPLCCVLLLSALEVSKQTCKSSLTLAA